MAGARHHILPRFLMNGFMSRLESKPRFTWLYRKEAAPREVSTKDVAVEKFFYESSEETADTAITAAEVGYSITLAGLRESPPGSTVSAIEASELTAHLLARTKHLRTSMEELGGFAMARFDEFLAGPDGLRKLIMAHPDFEGLVMDKALAMIPPDAPPQTTQVIMDALPILLPGFIDELGPAFAKEVGEVMEAVRRKIPELVKTSHVKVLRDSTAPETRIDVYRQLGWSLVETTIPLPLGDVAVLLEVKGTRRFKPFDDKEEELVGIYLPIATNRLLVGRPVGSRGKIDIGEIRAAYISVCREFFISGVEDEELKRLQSQLGTDSEILSQCELESIFREVLPC